MSCEKDKEIVRRIRKWFEVCCNTAGEPRIEDIDVDKLVVVKEGKGAFMEYWMSWDSVGKSTIVIREMEHFMFENLPARRPIDFVRTWRFVECNEYSTSHTIAILRIFNNKIAFEIHKRMVIG